MSFFLTNQWGEIQFLDPRTLEPWILWRKVSIWTRVAVFYHPADRHGQWTCGVQAEVAMRGREGRSVVPSSRVQRGQCLGERGALMDGHKGTFGLAQSQQESSWSSVGRVGLNEKDLSLPLPLSSMGFMSEKNVTETSTKPSQAAFNNSFRTHQTHLLAAR